MQRPVMDPMFLREPHDAPRHRRLAAILAGTIRAARWAGRQLLRQPFRRRKNAGAGDESTASKICRGLVYRLVFLPFGLTLASLGIVYYGTHPVRAGAPPADPAGLDVYFEPTSLTADDGARLEAWVVPAVDARRVVLNKDQLLRTRYPAVVLAHDFGRSMEQVMQLLGPLHEDGVFAVAVGLRGAGADGRARGQTFGVNEALDIETAVAMLRRRISVDPDRIAVFGIGTGANAALLAAERDERIAAVALADPVPTPEDAVARYVGPDRFGLAWMQVLNKWTFQMAYHVDLDDMRLSRADTVAATRPILRLDAQSVPDGRLTPAAIEQVRAFYRARLGR